ncbi:hypothetical protein CORMATOL_01522 [Corynebacterium matruchotii ATCC 33806]|uniref:Uncharacterized protein n=1 Tax=Corynebacterium matruchotii ATCC 33806 TaxID=566549 RepID=C0E3F9_9CORY|nr:hypothetical protein CORMATOL_01522 [Corynebacterium matruchotii ATCC 33806]
MTFSPPPWFFRAQSVGSTRDAVFRHPYKVKIILSLSIPRAGNTSP